MDSLKRRKPHRMRDAGSASAARIAEYILRGVDSPHIVVGPAVWQPSDGTAGKRWYCTIAASEAGKGFRCDQVVLSPDNPEADRASVIAAFYPHRPIIIHDMADELNMVKLCETLWPGPMIARLRRSIEAEQCR
jgi:hypothetical protein